MDKQDTCRGGKGRQLRLTPEMQEALNELLASPPTPHKRLTARISGGTGFPWHMAVAVITTVGVTCFVGWMLVIQVNELLPGLTGRWG
jgi:hypothetical protein